MLLIGDAVDEEEEEVTGSDILADCEGHFGILGVAIEESFPSSSAMDKSNAPQIYPSAL